MKIAIAILICGAVYAILAAVRYFFGKPAGTNLLFQRAARSFPAIEMIAWILVSVWLIKYLLSGSAYLDFVIIIAIAILAIFISLFILKDYLAGVQFRTRFPLKTGQNITVNNVTGHIRDFHLLYVVLTSDDGHQIKIPYSRLQPETVKVDGRKSTMSEMTLQLKIKKGLNQDEIAGTVMEAVGNSPWSFYKIPPSISKIATEENADIYEVVYRSGASHSPDQILKRLRNELGDRLLAD